MSDRARGSRPTRITVVGGGTGSYNLLRGLRRFDDVHVQAIVSMMDSGGDSGRLRDEFGVLPPGDVRRCLVALAEESRVLRNLFSYRFGEGPMEGRSFGNLFLLALTRMLGSEEAAIDALGDILKVRGRVLGVTWDATHLHAALSDGTELGDEASIDRRGHGGDTHIERVWLDPPANINPEAAGALVSADCIVLAPGDLFTSTLPNLLVTGMPEALRAARAPLVQVMNLMTKPGETDGFSASRHVEAVARYAGRVPDAVLVDDGRIDATLIERYAGEHSKRVAIDDEAITSLGVRTVHHASLMSAASFVRHDPRRTARAIVALCDELRNESNGNANRN